MRNKFRKNSVMGVFAIILLFIFSSFCFAESWVPFKFKGNEMYEYNIERQEDDKTSAIYSLKIEEIKGGKFRVEYSTRMEVERSNFNEQTAFGFLGSYGPLNFMFFNPMYKMLFEQLKLKVGEEMSYYGQGLMKVLGKENIAGRTGYICRLFDSDGSPVFEWVIDPELALPIRSTKLDEEVVEGETILLKYETF